jgi:hypothetical protein
VLHPSFAAGDMKSSRRLAGFLPVRDGISGTGRAAEAERRRTAQVMPRCDVNILSAGRTGGDAASRQRLHVPNVVVSRQGVVGSMAPLL